MKIAKREDFALIFMSVLANNYSDKFISLSKVAKKTHLSSFFLKHIAVLLKKEGLVESKEGINGGYRLSRHPQKIALSQIIQAISKEVISPSCKKGECRIRKITCSCSLLWKKVNEHLFSYLKSISLLDFTKTAKIFL